MKNQNPKVCWNLKYGILGLALSVSPFSMDGILAETKPAAAPAQKNAEAKPAVLQEEVYPAYDPVAGARKPERRKTVETIQGALEAAYLHNTDLKELQAQVRARDESVPQALAGWRPSVVANARVGGEKNIYSGSTKDTANSGLQLQAQSGLNQSTAQANVTVSQNIFNGGKTIASTCQAENSVLAARAQLLDKEREVLFATVQAYFGVVAKTAELEFRRSNELALKKTLEATRDKFNVGEETRTSIAQAEANLASGTADRELTEAQLLAAEANFEQVTGARPGKLKKPGEPFSLPRGLKEAIEIAQKNNPAIIAALYQEKADRNAIKVSDADLLPKLDVEGAVERTGQLQRTNTTALGVLQNHDFTTAQRVALNLKIPIYENGGLARGKSRELREIAEGRRIAIETARRKIVKQLVESWENYLSAKANVQNYRIQVKSNEVSLEGTRQEMLVGSKILLDVLNAQRDLVNSQLNLVRAEQSYYESAYSVLANMGRLNAFDMKLKVKAYNPHIHYNDVRNSW